MGREKRINLIGKRFGKLVVVEQFYNKGNKFVRCKCDCGGEITTSYSNLVSSAITSCRDCRKGKVKLTVGERPKRLNDYEIGEDIVKIKLTNGVAIVDLEDWDRLKNTYWNDARNKRIYGWHNGATTFLCRAILGDLCKGYKIIYKDGDIYNNRKSNFILVENKVFYSKSLQLSGDLDNK